jgi:F0F1-type ATP synthase membrane subunit b/b'
MKRIGQIDQDLDKAQEQLGEANAKLEEANKKSADVSTYF